MIRKTYLSVTDQHKSRSASGAYFAAGQKDRISEQFPDRVRKYRYSVILFLHQALYSEKNAYLRYDKLIMNGQTYVYDEHKHKPVKIVH